MAEAERIITERHIAAVKSFLQANAVDSASIDVIGFHGQTVLHRPESRLTVQIGDAHELARRLRIPVAFDFRAPDVAAGGHGAPLVPVFHRALAEAAGLELPAIILNIGGVANLTTAGTFAGPLQGLGTTTGAVEGVDGWAQGAQAFGVYGLRTQAWQPPRK